MKVIMPLHVSEAELKAMTLEQLREITGATFGIVYHADTKERLLAKLIRNINRLKLGKEEA